MRKLSSEEVEMLQDLCLDDSTKIIRYLDKKFEEQDKQNNKNMIFTILNTIIALIAAIAAIIGIIPIFL